MESELTKQCIVTGATGHLGNNLVRLLNKNGVCPKVLLLPDESEVSLEGCSYTVSHGDVRDENFLRTEISENSAVLHLAGIIDISSDDKTLLYDVNVNGVKNIADICFEKHCRVVYVSSVHAIQEKKKKQSMNEDANFDPEKVVGDYAKSKAIATAYFLDKCKEGLDGVVVFPGGIIGENDFKLSNMGKLVVDIANKDIKVRVSGGYSFVDVVDVAMGIWLALKKGKSGEGYLLSGNEMTVDEIFDVVGKFLNRVGFIPKLATGFVKIFSSLAELYYKIRKQKPLFTKYSLYTITSNHNFSNQKAMEELGFCPKPAKDAVLSSLKWFLENRPDLFKPSVLEEYRKTLVPSNG